MVAAVVKQPSANQHPHDDLADVAEDTALVFFDRVGQLAAERLPAFSNLLNLGSYLNNYRKQNPGRITPLALPVRSEISIEN